MEKPRIKIYPRGWGFAYYQVVPGRISKFLGYYNFNPFSDGGYYDDFAHARLFKLVN